MLSTGPATVTPNRQRRHLFNLLAGKPFKHFAISFLLSRRGVEKNNLFFLHLLIHNYLSSIILEECVVFNLVLRLFKNWEWGMGETYFQCLERTFCGPWRGE